MDSFIEKAKTDYWEDTSRRPYVGAGVTFLWIVILFFAALLPAINQARNAVTVRSQIETKEQQLKSNVDQLTIARTKYTAEQDNEGVVLGAVPNEPSIVTFTNEIDLAIGQNSLVAKEVVVTPITGSLTPIKKSTNLFEKVQIQSQEFKITVEGRYENMEKFINHMESIARYVQIKSVRIDARSRASEDVSINPLTLYVEGVAYYTNE